MKLIAAVDNNFGIGNKGKLLVHIPSDLKRFRAMTLGKVVVLGRKTLETFPQKQPLELRTNIILSKNKSYNVKGAIVVNSREELINKLKSYDTDDVYILGGESIYNMMLDYCDEAIITRLDYEYEADSYIKNLDKEENWEKVSSGEEQTFFDVIFRFDNYINNNPKEL